MKLYWNITLIFIYNMLCKASLILDKYSPFSLLLTILFHDRKNGKNRIDIEAINKASVNFMNNPNFGMNIRYANFFMLSLPLILLWGCMIFCIFLFNEGIMPNEHLFVSLVLVFICISFLINYIFLWKDNKYLFYMKKFKSKKIDAKTKCISLLIVVVPFLILIACIFCIS